MRQRRFLCSCIVGLLLVEGASEPITALERFKGSAAGYDEI